MMIEEIEVGMLVTAKEDVLEALCRLKMSVGTVGVVVAIKRYDDVYVEFELGHRITTVPTLCHPICLDAVL